MRSAPDSVLLTHPSVGCNHEAPALPGAARAMLPPALAALFCEEAHRFPRYDVRTFAGMPSIPFHEILSTPRRPALAPA
jgi:hypothetical protein